MSLIFISLVIFNFFCISIDANCKIQITKPIENWPLVLNSDSASFYEVNVQSEIDVQQGNPIRIACPGKNNKIGKLGIEQATISCSNGEIFTYGGNYVNFYDLGCASVSHNFIRISFKIIYFLIFLFYFQETRKQ
jgi:hypothetical protein